MAVTRDGEYILTGSHDSYIKKISIKDQTKVKDFGKICDDSLRTIELAPGDESFFLFDRSCNLKLIDLGDGILPLQFLTVCEFGGFY